MLFTITIDCDNEGRVTTWSQVDLNSPHMTVKILGRYEELQKKIERAIQPETINELPFKKQEA